MGAVFALFSGFYYWTPKITGRTVNDFLGKVHFWTLFIGVNKIVIKCFYRFTSIIAFNLLVYAAAFLMRVVFSIILLSKPISLNEIINRDLKDKEDNDIDNDTLDNKLINLPTPKTPKPNKGKY